MKCSTVIITLNEAEHIRECVSQARKVSDEVIVVDAESEDNTAELAKQAGARVIVRPWEGYGQAKNFGIDQASSDWILSLDGDEVLSDACVETLRALSPVDGTVYCLDIVTMYFGYRLRHSGFYPNWKKRLFHRRYFRWNELPVHEELEATIDYRVQRLRGGVLHFSFKTKEQYKEKLDTYARLAAKNWIQKGFQPSRLRITMGPAFRFIKTYLLDLGFLDGRAGYEIASMNQQANRKKIEYYLKMRQGGEWAE